MREDLARDITPRDDASDEGYGAPDSQIAFDDRILVGSADSSATAARANAWAAFVSAVNDEAAALAAASADVRRWPSKRISTSPLTVSSTDESLEASGRSGGASAGLRGAAGRSLAANAIVQQLLASSGSTSPLHGAALEVERQRVLLETAGIVAAPPGARDTAAALASPLLSRASGPQLERSGSALWSRAGGGGDGSGIGPVSPSQATSASVLRPPSPPLFPVYDAGSGSERGSASLFLPFSAPTAAELRAILEGSKKDAVHLRDRTTLSDAMAGRPGDATWDLPSVSRRKRTGAAAESTGEGQHPFSLPDHDQSELDIDVRLAEIRAERYAAEQQRLLRKQRSAAVLFQAAARGWLVRRSAALAALRTARDRVRRRIAQQQDAEAGRQRAERERLTAVLADAQRRRDAAAAVRNARTGSASLMSVEEARMEEERRAAARDFEQRLLAQLGAVQDAEAAARRREADERQREDEQRLRREVDRRAEELAQIDELRAAVADENNRMAAAMRQAAAEERSRGLLELRRSAECRAMALEDAQSHQAEAEAVRLHNEKEAAKAAAAAADAARAAEAAMALAAAKPAALHDSLAVPGGHSPVVVSLAPAVDSSAVPSINLAVVSADANPGSVTDSHSAKLPRLDSRNETVTTSQSSAGSELPVGGLSTSANSLVSAGFGADGGVVRRVASAGGRAVMMLRPSSPGTARERTNAAPRPSAATHAARRLQTLWRGYRVRSDARNPIVLRRLARRRELERRFSRFQAVVRGGRVRSALRAVLEAARFRDPDEFDYAAVDVETFLGGLPDVDDLVGVERALAAGPRAAWSELQRPPLPASAASASADRGMSRPGTSGVQARVRAHHTAAEAALTLPPPAPGFMHPQPLSSAPAARGGALPPVRPGTSSGGAAPPVPGLGSMPPPQQHQQLLRSSRPDTSSSAAWELASVRTADEEGSGVASWPSPLPPPAAAAAPSGGVAGVESVRSRRLATMQAPLARTQPMPGEMDGRDAGRRALGVPPPLSQTDLRTPGPPQLASGRVGGGAGGLLQDPAALELLVQRRRRQAQQAHCQGHGLAATAPRVPAQPPPAGVRSVQSMLPLPPPQPQPPFGIPSPLPRGSRGEVARGVQQQQQQWAGERQGAAASVSAAQQSSALQRALGVQAGLLAPEAPGGGFPQPPGAAQPSFRQQGAAAAQALRLMRLAMDSGLPVPLQQQQQQQGGSGRRLPRV